MLPPPVSFLSLCIGFEKRHQAYFVRLLHCLKNKPGAAVLDSTIAVLFGSHLQNRSSSNLSNQIDMIDYPLALLFGIGFACSQEIIQAGF